MKTATVKEIKNELQYKSEKELIELCLTFAKFKKENKELATYLLFEAADEDSYIKSVKEEVDDLFTSVNRKNYYYIKKGIRKALNFVKKHIRYSKSKETEVELLLYFCKKMKSFTPTIRRNTALQNLLVRQLNMVERRIELLHEDLQYDYGEELETIIKMR